ncbi:MAG: hypothetical protein M1436_08680 [Acidobacteria bacterium]|nr:hypothetical protein [Acidobacteriota bacterium]
MDTTGVGKAGGALPAPERGSGEREDPGKIRSAARDFEALLISQMLRSMRENQEGWLGTGEEDQAGAQAMELAEEQFARALSASGGLGLTRLIVNGFNTAPPVRDSNYSRHSPAAQPPGSQPTEN